MNVHWLIFKLHPIKKRCSGQSPCGLFASCNKYARDGRSGWTIAMIFSAQRRDARSTSFPTRVYPFEKPKHSGEELYKALGLQSWRSSVFQPAIMVKSTALLSAFFSLLASTAAVTVP